MHVAKSPFSRTSECPCNYGNLGEQLMNVCEVIAASCPQCLVIQHHQQSTSHRDTLASASLVIYTWHFTN